MAIELNNYIEIKAQQTFNGHQVLNVFHYEVTSIETTIVYEDIADEFDNFWNIHVAPNVSSGLLLEKLVLRNLTNEVDLYEHTSGITGDIASGAAADLLAFGFRFNRLSAVTRHGFKRFAGVTESVMSQNTIDASKITAFQNWADEMALGISRTGTAADFELNSVIIGRTKNESGTYELDITRVNGISGVQFTGITSQVTRKPGRGS